MYNVILTENIFTLWGDWEVLKIYPMKAEECEIVMEFKPKSLDYDFAIGLKVSKIVKLGQKTLAIKLYLPLEYYCKPLSRPLLVYVFSFCSETMTQYPAFQITPAKIIKKVILPEVLFSLMDNKAAKH